MKEELIKVLNSKLDDINGDIDSLVELNEKIAKEKEELSYISSILDIFKDNDVMNFSQLSKNDFYKVLDILDGDVKDVFSSPSCNYEGLVYLINGINDGVSLALTDEQKNGIMYLIEKLTGKKEEHESAIEGFNLVKNRYLINDIDELKIKKENYLNVLDELDKNQYVSDISLLQEAIDFSSISTDKTIDILKYLLEYNATVYKNGTDLTDLNETKEDNSDTLKQEDIVSPDLTVDHLTNDDNVEKIEVSTSDEEKTDEYQEFHFNDVTKDEFTNFSPLHFIIMKLKKQMKKKLIMI